MSTDDKIITTIYTVQILFYLAVIVLAVYKLYRLY